MAQPIYWGDAKVPGGWTDREWERLQKVKNGEFVAEVSEVKDVTITSAMSAELKQKVIRYAKEKGWSPSQLIRETLFVLMD